MPDVLEIEERTGIVYPPWETTSDGVVSLLAMLEFAAFEYIEISYLIGEVLATFRKSPLTNADLSVALKRLMSETTRLNLQVTKSMVSNFLLEIAKENPGSVFVDGEGDDRVFVLRNAGLSNERTCHHLESIYSALKSELRTTLLKAIPKERAAYNGLNWLLRSKLASGFPTSFTELGRAGDCYSLGQPTACVFHSMRALELGLVVLAGHFQVSASHENWNTIIERIEAEIRRLGHQQKSEQKTVEEKFFGSAASHLYFVKNAWRNHVAHARDSYGDDEALKIMLRTHDFIESLCERLQE